MKETFLSIEDVLFDGLMNNDAVIARIKETLLSMSENVSQQ